MDKARAVLREVEQIAAPHTSGVRRGCLDPLVGNLRLWLGRYVESGADSALELSGGHRAWHRLGSVRSSGVAVAITEELGE